MTRSELRIILVEDDMDLAESWRDLFVLLGYKISIHFSGASLLSNPKEIINADILISDYYLPEINGVELIEKAREINPKLKTILLTGSRDSIIPQQVKRLPICKLVYKPINIETLEKHINSLSAA